MLTVQISMGRLSLLSKPVFLYILGGVLGCHAVLLSQIQKARCERATLQVRTIFMSVRGHKSIKCLKYKSAFLSFVLHVCQSTRATQIVGSDTSLARHAQPYAIRIQAWAALFQLAGTCHAGGTPLSSSEERYLKTSGRPEFHQLPTYRTAELVYLWVWRQPASWLKPREVTSQKLKPMVTLRVERCFILKLWKRLDVYGEAQGSQLWASACVPLPNNQLT